MSSDIRERLRRVLGPSRSPPADLDMGADRPPPDVTSRPGESPRPGAAPPSRRRDVDRLVAGAIHDGPLGACFVAERSFPLDYRHGAERLGGFYALDDRALGCLARSATLPPLDREAVLFLDTETTGLAGGTGTYAFLIGLGWFEAERFVVRQFFMRHHAEEPAMLALLNAAVARFEAIVSFNGKAFDVPLIVTRFTANRQRSALRLGVHLDLLHPSRRIWRDRLESCTLGALERAVLGHQRERDVPSWMIPDLYFRYVRGESAGPMVRVFEHNLHDILSLVSLTCRLGRLLGAPADAAPEDVFAVGRIYEALGLTDDACACYERTLDTSRSADLRAKAAARLAALCKRTARHDRAVQLWRRLALLGLDDCTPLVELAKHYEHRARDFDAAIAVVEEALVVVELRGMRLRLDAAAERAALEHRLARLIARRGRVASGQR
ncbi:MAG: ribonuclease H-like domain-containing protein [Chloroflexi bacterium]|nr:ribonuclease H-like domain-containing protein [Chloroflexota bacterium]